MGVQLNIKDPETIRMAKELAGRHGGNVTAAIRTALSDALDTQQAERARKLAEIDAIVADIRRQLPDEAKGMTSKEMMDALYDEDGLPG